MQLCFNRVLGIVSQSFTWIIGDWGKAEVDYSKALELQPDDPVAHKRRADARGKLGQKEKAVEDYHYAVQLQARIKFLKSINTKWPYYTMADYFSTILMICQLDVVFVKVALTVFCHCAFLCDLDQNLHVRHQNDIDLFACFCFNFMIFPSLFI